MNRKMTLLARGGNVPASVAKDCTTRMACRRGHRRPFNSEASASAPKPPPARSKNSRRERASDACGAGRIELWGEFVIHRTRLTRP